MKIRPWDRLMEGLPLLSSQQKEGLRKSLERDGQQYEILLLPDGRIIDGVNRFEILGNKVKYKILDIDEESAFILGVALRVDRGQLSVEQHRELMEWFAKNKDKQKAVAMKLREEGKTQKEVAEVIGVSQQTISNWDKERKDEVGTNTNSSKGSQKTPSVSQNADCRNKTKKEQKEEIVQRVKAGESHRQVAADYGISHKAVEKIVKTVDKPKTEKPHDVDDDISKLRVFIEKLRNNWKTEADKSAIRQFLRQTAHGI